MKLLTTIENCPVYLNDDGSILIPNAGAQIDNDGSGGNPEGDPYHQSETSLRVNGKSLNAQTVPYIVLPPAVIKAVEPYLLGCSVTVSYNGKTCAAVVGDVGPHNKLGEISVECARRLGINPSPIHGGVESGVRYLVRPGVRAIVDQITYPLQHF